MYKNIFILILYLVSFTMFTSNIAKGTDVEVPIQNQLQILQKMLSMESSIQGSKSCEIVVGVLYQSGNKISNSTKKDIFAYVSNKKITIGKSALKFIPIEISNSNIIETLTKSEQCQIFIVTQLRSINYKDILKYSTSKSVLTFSSSAENMLQYKLSMAVGYKGNNPQPIINQKNLNEEGYHFPYQVLKYSKIIE